MKFSKFIIDSSVIVYCSFIAAVIQHKSAASRSGV